MDRIEIIKAAIRESIADMEVFGYKVSTFITDEQLTAVATAVAEALENAE